VTLPRSLFVLALLVSIAAGAVLAFLLVVARTSG
jgi:hypothetical protein